MARVKKPWSTSNDVTNPESEAASNDVDMSPESESPLTIITDETPIPAVPPVPETPVAPAPVKVAVAKVYQAGDEYSAGGKKGKVIVVLKDVLKVRWADGSIGFVKK